MRAPPCLFVFLLSLLAPSLSSAPQKVYIVYMGEHSGLKNSEEIHSDHHSLLSSVKSSDKEARESLVYSYKSSINGFAALLTEAQANQLAEAERVISAFPSLGRSSPHTTRSWEFLGLEEGLIGSKRKRMPSKAKHGKNVIVGMLDSGIWPESKSFHDKGLGPVPGHWRGICEEGDFFNSSHCNKKIIGARYYLKGYEAAHGLLNTSYAYRSPRDHDGHGTHTTSTVAGRVARGVSALGGLARGTAAGGAPLARLAIYKVCWPIPGPNPNLENTCFDADMLAAMDDAIGDGVHVISISIGATGASPMFPADGIALGALHATKNNIVVACSAGNSGPALGTVANLAPWLITVGASSIDRDFRSTVILGNGMKLKGNTFTQNKSNKFFPLVYAGDVEVPGTPSNASGQCLPNSLLADKVKGKTVLCLRGQGTRFGKGIEVKRAGGAAIILGNDIADGDDLPMDAYILPGNAVSSNDAIGIMKYINSTGKPRVMVGPVNTVVGVKPSMVMTGFSSRGPSRVEPNILKPDITAPGYNILAAWSEASSPTKMEDDHRIVKYNLLSGTSMSCPHVSAVATLLKSLYPNWSSAAIRSAMMTTATILDVEGAPITNWNGKPTGPLEFGSGHIRPTHAADPGLVYDASYTDYLLFACSGAGGGQLDPSFPCPSNPPPPCSLNYPSVAVSGLNGTITIRRTVTNVGHGRARYRVSFVDPVGVSVGILPEVLRFRKAGQKKSFVITLRVVDGGRSTGGEYVGGSYTWSDGVHAVRSPIVVSIV